MKESFYFLFLEILKSNTQIEVSNFEEKCKELRKNITEGIQPEMELKRHSRTGDAEAAALTRTVSRGGAISKAEIAQLKRQTRFIEKDSSVANEVMMREDRTGFEKVFDCNFHGILFFGE